jgi:antitoxin FitA
MSNIQIKHVPPDLHTAVRARATNERMTVSEYVLEVIRRDLSLPSRREWLRRLENRHPIDVEAVAARV